MQFKIDVAPKAQAEAVEALTYHAEQQEGLDEKFISKLQELFKKISINPEIYTNTVKKLRRAPMKTFPFVIVFSIDQKNKVVYISSIFHTSRNPRQKLKK